MNDDSAAVKAAVEALRVSGPGSKLIFEKDKTYYISALSGDSRALFELDRLKGITIQGENTGILLGAKKSYASVTNTKNCVISGFNFDYAIKPAFGAVCSSVSVSEGSAVMVADRDIGLEDGEIYTPPYGLSYWGVLNKSDSRYHMYITKYQMINREKRVFRIYFDMSDANTAAWLESSLRQSGMVCPMPGWGQLPEIERGFTVTGNLDLTFSDIDINSCCRFGMFIADNEGTLNIKDVDFVPADNSIDSGLAFTSWRDAFHVKDNRCKIIWDGCDAVSNYDDVINISSSALAVTAYDGEKREISLVWRESSSGLYYKIKKGDVLSVIDTVTGADCGTAEVTEVVKQSDGVNTVILSSSLGNISSTDSLIAYFTNRCAPDSVITGCSFNGTFRFRGPLMVSESQFYNMRMWIDTEGSVEGPVPRDITFKNCDILPGKGSQIIINSYNKINDGYHVENIRFSECVLEDSTLAIGENDKDYVVFESCRRHDGTFIE